VERVEESKRPETPRWDDKLEALRAFRHSKGLYFTCGDKWSRTHKCPSQVPLHVPEELLDVLPTESGIDDNGDSASSEDELMCVNTAVATSNSTACRRMIRLHDRVSHILVDSGSGASFVDANLVSRLRLEPHACTPSRFVVANGDTMVSDTMIPKLTWEAQGHSFQQDMKVLSLGCYDIILGGDWLEEFSPMWVHWRQHRMRFRHQGHHIMLQGILDDGSPGRPISAQKLQGLLRRGVVS
jgi:hypothetical protein